MKRNWILDTGPLIALLDRHDHYHEWACQQFAEIIPPLLTCEAVLAEACFLIVREGRPGSMPLELLDRGVLRLGFTLAEHQEEIRSLMTRYSEVPMSLADACLVRMSELVTDSTVLTLNSDFRVYRRHGRSRIPVRIPSGC